MFFLLKSDVQGELEKVLERVQEKMKNYCRKFDVTHSQPPSKVRQLCCVHCVMFLSKTFYSHSASLHPGV